MINVSEQRRSSLVGRLYDALNSDEYWAPSIRDFLEHRDEIKQVKKPFSFVFGYRNCAIITMLNTRVMRKNGGYELVDSTGGFPIEGNSFNEGGPETPTVRVEVPEGVLCREVKLLYDAKSRRASILNARFDAYSDAA